MPFPSLYAALARRRRRWYESRPAKRRRLEHPVVSVGALSVGGSGKTPVAAEVAKVLVGFGERPAILSRGYGRARRPDGPVVVSDRGSVQAEIDVAGDEPFMLARRLPNVSVVVAEDRYLAGQVAETTLGATVHVLDDGFQHFTLDRDVDLLVVTPDDLADPRTLPWGRLREPVDVATRADALVIEGADDSEIAARLGVETTFFFSRRLDEPRHAVTSEPVQLAPRTKVLAVAGIARPRTFVDALTAAGYDVVSLMSFRDHHAYSERDVTSIAKQVTAVGADHAVTTEKDVVRLLRHAPFGCSILWTPLAVSLEPHETFAHWLADRLVVARGAR